MAPPAYLRYDKTMHKSLSITKSDYQLFLESPLHLWAKKNGRDNIAPSKFETHLTTQGYEVEALAESYLEKHLLDSAEGESIQLQREFSDKQFLARTDALIFKPQTNTYDLYEIKSSARKKKEFIFDAGFQYLIIQKHIKIDRIYILHLNKDYVRSSHLALEKLFVAEEISKDIEPYLDEIAVNREKALAIALTASPEGIQHCYKPKTCPYPNLCHPDLPENSIYNIPRISEKKKAQLLAQGVLNIKDVPATFSLNEKQQKIVAVAQRNKPHIDRKAIKQEFEGFEYPLYFLDYETFLSATPLFAGYQPQQQMVFQYSLHKINSPGEEPVHTDHLSITKNEPSASLVKELCKDIGDTGTIFVWNKTFEISRNREMAIIHPDYAEFLNKINDRIYDLGDIIKKGFYIHPDFLGSWSIKKVLPVMVPELSYEGMEIGKGDQAMVAWWGLVKGELSEHEAEKTKTALLEYCKLDSYAMVAIFMKFSELLA